MEKKAQALSLSEQYAFTTELNQEFACALKERMEGVPTLLFFTDQRQLDAKDLPGPWLAHVFLTLSDGTVLDGEGRRSLEALLRSFEVKKGYAYELVSDPEWTRTTKELGRPDLRWKKAIANRLDEAGWSKNTLPEGPARSRSLKTWEQADQDWEEDKKAWFEKYRKGSFTAPRTRRSRALS